MAKAASVLQEQFIKQKLDEDFVKTDEVAAILRLAIVGKKNALIYGPGGYGKSEMVKRAMDILVPKNCKHVHEGSYTKEVGEDGEAVILDEDGNIHECDDECKTSDVFVMSFGEDMSESKLWGGVDFEAWHNEKKLSYAPQYSFLNYKVVIFEEIFDAPASVLLALKDTLSARELRKGAQRFPMKTECIIGLTNKDPNEMADLDSNESHSYKALMERFPLRLVLNWETHTARDYKELFDKRYPDEHEEIKSQLASITETVVEKGEVISPRIALDALNVCVFNADRDNDMYQALRFVPGYEMIVEDLHQQLHDASIRRDAVNAIMSYDTEYEAFLENAKKADDLHDLGRAILGMQQVDAQLETLPLPDDLYDKRTQLRVKIAESIVKGKVWMMELAQKAAGVEVN